MLLPECCITSQRNSKFRSQAAWFELAGPDSEATRFVGVRLTTAPRPFLAGLRELLFAGSLAALGGIVGKKF